MINSNNKMRRTDREVKDINKIIALIGESKIMHIAIHDSIYPYIVTMHYGYEYIDGKLVFYLHSALEGKKIDLIKQNDKICFTIVGSKFELIKGDTPCKYGSTFSSVVGMGNIDFITDIDEKIKGLNLLMKNQTDKTFEFTSEMVEKVAVLRINVLKFSCKERKM